MTSGDPRAGLLEPRALLEELRRAGAQLADAAGRAGLDAPVPSCPQWDVRALVRHTGGVHRWATAHVAGALVEEIPDTDDLGAYLGGWPADEGLLEWFVEGHRALVGALQAAPDDLVCFSFLPAPSAKWFWTRRQAHETAMHAIDAELAAGGSSERSASFAADGLDELLRGFVPRMRRRYTSAAVEQLDVLTTDAGRAIRLRITPDGPKSELIDPGDAEEIDGFASGVISGPADALYRWGWARAGRSQLVVRGDDAVIDHFEQAVHINW